MNVYGKHYRTIWIKADDPQVAQIIEQRLLPHKFVVEDLTTVDDVGRAIKGMDCGGAGFIGAKGGYGMYIAALHAPRGSVTAFKGGLVAAGEKVKGTRPTAVNLEWAVERQLEAIRAAGDD